jgi:subtilisin family serine protease
MRLFSTGQFLSLCVFIFLNLGCTKEFQKDSSSDFQLSSNSNGNAQLENNPAGARIIKDAYIVVFRDDVADVDQLTEALSKQGGFKARFKYKNAIKGFAASIPEQALPGISRNPNVKYVEPDQEVRLEATQTGATWGLDRIDQQSLPLSGSYTYNSSGSSVDAYIFDTGIRYDHTEFGGRAFKLFDATITGGDGVDRNGHGTHVAGTVGGATYGVAKSVTLYGVKVLGDGGSGSYSGIIAGMEQVIIHHTTKPAVGNMSLGGGASVSVDDAVRNVIADGVVMCVAAGNSNVDAINTTPARTIEAITVGSTTSTDARSSFSNYGSVVDIFAPGSSITSAWYTGTTATNTISGTSMASPHVAGASALYLEAFPGSTPAQVQQGLKNYAIPGKVTSVPAGTVNLLLYMNFVPSSNPPSAASLISPANSATGVSTSPTFSWAAATNATSYTLQVSADQNFASFVSQQNTTVTSASVVGLAQATLYYWRVIAKNNLGEATSLLRSFTTLLNSPSLVSPANTAKNISRTPTLSWSSVSGADGYELMVSTSSSFSTSTTYSTAGTSYVLPLLSSRITYYWRVRAKKGTVFSSWSGSRRFTTI